jgi:hypothetical protein
MSFGSAGSVARRARRLLFEITEPWTHHLDGSAPDQAETALLLIDVINALDFSNSERLVPHAMSSTCRWNTWAHTSSS